MPPSAVVNHFAELHVRVGYHEISFIYIGMPTIVRVGHWGLVKSFVVEISWI